MTVLTGDEPVSMNFWGFTPEIFGQLKEHFRKFLEANGGDLKTECYIPSTVNEIMVAGQGAREGAAQQDSWFGVTYREDHAHVVESIRRLVERRYLSRKTLGMTSEFARERRCAGV